MLEDPGRCPQRDDGSLVVRASHAWNRLDRNPYIQDPMVKKYLLVLDAGSVPRSSQIPRFMDNSGEPFPCVLPRAGERLGFL